MDRFDRSALLDALDDLFFVFDASGTVVEWNQTVVDVTGYSEDELKQLSPPAFFEGEDSERVATAVAEVFETGAATIEADLVTADGETIPYEFSARRLTEGDETIGLAGIGRDITRRKRTEHERQAILDRMSDAFMALDRDWQLTLVNESAREILGAAMDRDPAEDTFVGLNLWEEIPEAVDTTYYERYHEAMETQEAVSFEEYFDPLDTWFDVRAYPSETGLSVFFYDITELRRQRDRLANRDQVLRAMYEIMADSELQFEEQVERLLALGRRELDTAYGTLSQIRGEEYLFEHVSAEDDAVQSGDVVPLSATNCEIAATTEQTLVLGNVARDAPEETHRTGYTDMGISCYIGAPVYVDDDVYGTFCFYDTDPKAGQFSEWEETLVDIMSRWVSYELQRQQTNKELARQNEQLEKFASIVSHDLRNPLNVLAGSLELAADADEPDAIDRCYRAIDRMETIIDDLMTLARAGAAIDELEPVSLPSIVEGCWDTVSTGDATLAVKTDETIVADESRLRQLFENLFRNAVEHGGSGVSVVVESIPHGFAIADDGPGIPADECEAVFESGFTTTADGTGFGLAIVREIVEAHGWDIRVTESADGGARFEIMGVEFVT